MRERGDEMIKCLKCNENISNDMFECASCGASINQIKFNFITYIGPEDSLFGYQKSYKLVLLKYIFEEYIKNGQATVVTVIKSVKQFYMDRYEQGLIPEIDADDRIKNIQTSSEHDVFAVMKSQPYKVINEKGFLFLNRNPSNDLIFTFHEDMINALDTVEMNALLDILQRKIILYFKKIDISPVVACQSNNTLLDAEENTQQIAPTYNPILYIDITQISPLSVRAINCLKRANLNNLQEVIEFLQTNQLSSIRNLGASN